MATQTTYYSLVKPATSDAIDVTQMNGNMDTIDGTMNSLQTGLNNTVRFVSQELTDNQKQQARANIGALEETAVSDVIRYSSQTLTDEQKTQVRTNIGAAAQTDLTGVTDLLSGLFKIASYSTTIETMPASTKNITREEMGFTNIEGYKAVGLVRWSLNSRLCICYCDFENESKLLTVRNVLNSETTNANVNISVLWVKSSLVQQS